MSFLNDLLGEFSLGENNISTLSTMEDGKKIKYGRLGDFADKFDRTAQRKYLEQGYMRSDAIAVDVKLFESIFKQPIATVIARKRQYSSLAENYRFEYMDNDERLFYRSMNILFQNKCRQISALEKLFKLNKFIKNTRTPGDDLLTVLFQISDGLDGGVESISGNFSAGGSKDISSFKSVINNVKKIYGFGGTSRYTSWLADTTNFARAEFGNGNGSIELTTFASINTSVTNSIETPGNATIDIFDPYESFTISEYDIEKAISDATNLAYNKNIFQFSLQESQNLLNDLQSKFNKLREDRKASRVSFRINPKTITGKRVVAIIDRIGKEIEFEFSAFSAGALLGGLDSFFSDDGDAGVEVNKSFLLDGDVAGFDGLSSKRFNTASRQSELSLFQQIIQAIYNKISLEANSQNSFQLNNEKTNYARKKLTFYFLGKSILQPMDKINIYMASKTKRDTKILSGLKDIFSGYSVTDKIKSQISDIKESFDAVFRPEAIANQVEKLAFVGSEFPNFLWQMLKPSFTNENEGSHVFAGVISSVTSSWDNNSPRLSISINDNSAYLNMGKVNFSPSVDVWNGDLYDPLTPFKTDIEMISSNFDLLNSELLPENKSLLSTDLFKAKSGANAGKVINNKNYIQDRYIDPITGNQIKTFFAPDGLVYKWKEGIGTLSYNGPTLNSRTGIPSITKDPFQGQDVMNIISLLITGVPYNYSTFLQAAKVQGYFKDNQNAAYTFLDSLQNDLIKRNALWGSFIPFKSINVDEGAYSAQLRAITSITKNNSILESKLVEYKEIQQSILILQKSSSILKLEKDISSSFRGDELYSEIQNLVESSNQSLQGDFALVGNDVFHDIDNILYSSDNEKERDVSFKKLVAKRLNYLTRRMSYNVRANVDRNYFIVDDSYDKDYDLAAFAISLNQITLFDNQFLSPKDKIIAAAKVLDLEVMCDTQGNIRIRPPQFNRMPSSVYYRLKEKEKYGIKILPKFFSDLSTTLVDTLKTRIEVIEDYIRLYSAILNFNTDEEVVDFINQYSLLNGGKFQLFSDSFGNISDLEPIFDPPTSVSSQENILSSIRKQTFNKGKIFTPDLRAKFINETLRRNDVNLTEAINSSLLGGSIRIEEISRRLRLRTTDKIDISKFTIPIQSISGVDLLGVSNKISSKLAERQKLLLELFKSAKNLIQINSLNQMKENDNIVLFPELYPGQEIPTFYQSMIEDESYDDLGPGSGSRFVIENKDILRYNISETPPPFTEVTVVGNISEGPQPFVIDTPQSLNIFNGSSALSAATAVDYDMWRNYGFVGQNAISVPFLQDPKTQLEPYAATVLSRARKNILNATITITGNEYMQPGEVVYLKQKNLLFYVNRVSHSFSVNQTFTTTLNLSYGHAPGDYIPDYLDVIGKLLYNGRYKSGLRVDRQTSSFNDSPIGVLVLPSEKRNYEESNNEIIQNILFKAKYLVSQNNNRNISYKSTVELRIYSDSETFDSELVKFAEEVKLRLTKNIDDNPESISLDSDNVSIIFINISDKSESRSPSQLSISKAREIKDPSLGDESFSLITENIFSFIVDCYLKKSKA